MAGRLGSFAAALLLLLPGAAAAEAEIRIAIMDFASRNADDLIVKEAGARVNAELHKLGVFQVTSKDDIRAMISMEKEKTLLGCEEATCLAEIGGALGVDYMINGTITKVDARYTIDLRLVNIKKASVDNVVNKSVEGSASAVIDAAADAGVNLVAKIFAAKQGFLVLGCDEAGATVKVDGTEWTTTPVRGRITLPFGPHTVEVSKTGFLSWRERVTIQPNQAIEKDVPLIPSPDFIADYESYNSKMRLGAWISTVLAVGAVGASGYFAVAANGAYSDFQGPQDAVNANPADADARSEAESLKSEVERLDTLTYGSIGAVVVTGGLATFFWIAGDDPGKYERFRDVGGPTPGGGEAPAASSGLRFDPTRMALTF